MSAAGKIVMVVALAVAAPAYAGPDAALSRHQKRCDRGDAKACLAAAELLDRDRAASDDDRLRYYTAACDGGAARGCFRAGALLAQQPSPSLDRVLAVFEKGCRGGDGMSCGGAGSVLFTADFGPRDWARAWPFYREACDRGVAIASIEAGHALESGVDGVPADPAQALRCYQAACTARSAIGCRAAGRLALRTSATPADRRAALTLLTRACDGGDADGCLGAGRLHLDGDLPPRVASRAKGRTLIEQGCKRQAATLPPGARAASEARCIDQHDPDADIGTAEGLEIGGVAGSAPDEPMPPPPPPAPPRAISAAELEGRRIAGDTTVPVPPDAVAELGDRRQRARVIVKICLSATGAPMTVTLRTPSRSPSFDRAAMEAARQLRYRPYQVDGRSVPVCAPVELRATGR